ncbi:MAG TPA: hypothetical protein VFY32_09670 [Solirubrobacteraceae bacterium]|nr:hypothetical protein [Solirubrobacteraceae bacterium]
MSKYLRYAGIAASAILIVFGVASMIIGANGRSTVRSNLAAEKISGSDDMTPAAIKAEAKEAGLKNVDFPTCSVAGKAVNNGATARCFAQYMRIHALEATGGLVYAEMGQYLDKSGKPTSDKTAAAIDPVTKKPVPNAARNTWVTETALGTALNTSYFAENVALFSIVMGAALLLTGIGFLVVTLGLLGIAARKEEDDAAVRAPATSAVAS